MLRHPRFSYFPQIFLPLYKPCQKLGRTYLWSSPEESHGYYGIKSWETRVWSSFKKTVFSNRRKVLACYAISLQRQVTWGGVILAFSRQSEMAVSALLSGCVKTTMRSHYISGLAANSRTSSKSAAPLVNVAIALATFSLSQYSEAIYTLAQENILFAEMPPDPMSFIQRQKMFAKNHISVVFLRQRLYSTLICQVVWV